MKKGFSDVIVGLEYGDEGKGRISDQKLASGDYSVVARFNGGNNAGHTLVNEKGEKIILNSIPSGVLHPGIINYIGSGCVVDPVNLVEVEIPRVEKVTSLKGRLKISANATAITPFHIYQDEVGSGMIGSTGKGIGPAYTGKARRAYKNVIENWRMGDIVADPEQAAEMIWTQFKGVLYENDNQSNLVDALFFNQTRQNIISKIESFIEAVKKLDKAGYIEYSPLWLTEQVENGGNVLMEGAQAYGLDVTNGVVPFSTSSNTIASNAYVGGDLSAKFHRKIMGVAKLTPSKVGNGHFVGEYGGVESDLHCSRKEAGKIYFNREQEKSLFDFEAMLDSKSRYDFGVGLRMKTDEYGATTGRPRRLGVIDLVRLSQASRFMGVDEIYLTKFDCLREFVAKPLWENGLPIINKYQLNGKEINYAPNNDGLLRKVVPVEIAIPFPEELRGLADGEKLPENARYLVGMIQDATKAKVVGLGTGPAREEMFML